MFKRYIKQSIWLAICLQLSACSEDSSEPSVSQEQIPDNFINSAFILDTDSQAKQLSGALTVTFSNNATPEYINQTEFQLFWVDENDVPIGDAFWQGKANDENKFLISQAKTVPDDISTIAIFSVNDAGLSSGQFNASFKDLNAPFNLAGAGGKDYHFWHYGSERPYLQVQKQDDMCIFDNGIVAVIDMQNQQDSQWHSGYFEGGENQVDDDLFPSYAFDCNQTQFHDLDKIEDEFGVWTYSANNDALYFTTLINDTLTEVLKTPPFTEKIRVRTHYDKRWSDYAFWDGAYINLSDGYPLFYSNVVIDVIAHELAHAILTTSTELNPFLRPLSADARTAHEAFADIVGVVVKSKTLEYDNLWIHGESHHGFSRNLSQIRTESDAIPSYLDYQEAGTNYYKRIGMLTYPFYLLSQHYGVEEVFHLYHKAATSCWSATMALADSAQCLLTSSEHSEIEASHIVDAFKRVKLPLQENLLLSHFLIEKDKLEVSFSANVQNAEDIQIWYWNFGDGNDSYEENPNHIYSKTGTYKASLVVTDANGDSDTFYRYISVYENF